MTQKRHIYGANTPICGVRIHAKASICAKHILWRKSVCLLKSVRIDTKEPIYYKCTIEYKSTGFKNAGTGGEVRAHSRKSVCLREAYSMVQKRRGVERMRLAWDGDARIPKRMPRTGRQWRKREGSMI